MTSYFQNLELINFIKIDLERLYMNGIPDEYFFESQRKERLINILAVWSIANPAISYRQGMHEVLGGIYKALEIGTFVIYFVCTWYRMFL